MGAFVRHLRLSAPVVALVTHVLRIKFLVCVRTPGQHRRLLDAARLIQQVLLVSLLNRRLDVPLLLLLLLDRLEDVHQLEGNFRLGIRRQLLGSMERGILLDAPEEQEL